MSCSLSAHRRGVGRTLAALLGFGMVALALVGLAPEARADFSTAKCAGPNILGRGASFARDAHGVFNFNFKHNYCLGTPGQDTIDVSYDAAGSGAGRTSMKVRNDTPRFGMSDEPPSTNEIQQMDKGTGSGDPGTDPNPNDNGRIHVIPAAVGSVAPLVNFPNGCDPTALAPASRTDAVATTDDNLLRVRFNKAQFEAAWAQGAAGVPYVTWRDVFPELADNAACKSPIIRVVRFDESGTSFAFKNYLDTISPGRGWLTTYAFGTNLTREWPGATFGTGGQCPVAAPGSQADSLDHLTSGCSNGNGTLVSTLIATDGSIGYSDISTARAASPSLAVDPAGVTPPDKYWTQVQNGSNTFTEPTADPNGFLTNGTKGANCSGATFSNVPSSTLEGNWSQTTGVNAPGTAYGICTLTYGLVFDDNAPVWGDTPAEEAKARTVKDYWQNIVSDGAQGQLFSKDYAPLPASILTISRAGVTSIGWNKSSSGGGNPPPTGGGNPPPSGGGGGGGGGAAVSNAFSVPKKSISSKDGSAKFSVRLPGAGKFDLVGTAKVGKSKIKVGQVVLNAGKAGTFELVLKPSGAAKAALRKQGSLKVSITFTFSPTGGETKKSTTTVTLKLAAKKAAKKG